RLPRLRIHNPEGGAVTIRRSRSSRFSLLSPSISLPAQGLYMTDTSKLFEPLQVGNITINNRLAMAPMTRQRSYLNGTPTDLNVEHYRQRASAGLIITEGIAPSEMGWGYLFSPGLYNDSHEAGWRKVSDA